MRFLKDENIYPQMVETIRNLSHDVLDIKEQNLFSMLDSEVIKMAQDTGRILITFDKDFSNIVMYPPLITHSSVRSDMLVEAMITISQ